MKKIALEEAFLVAGDEKIVPELLTRREFEHKKGLLLDLAEDRLRAMDEGEIELSVLSATSPGVQGLSSAADEQAVARQWNDYLAEAISRHEGRFEAFASIPMRDPQAAAHELTRAVKELGFVGALINGYDNSGRQPSLYYDAAQYVDFWKIVAGLDVPLYVHPRSVPEDRVTTYMDYPELRGAAWGFHVETAEHILRMILSGLFDEVPDLKIIIGHMGEILPFWAWRIDHRIQREGWDIWAAGHGRPRKHTVTEYLRRNFFITTSGLFDTASLVHAISVMGSDRILYSVDYPYESTTEANEWFNGLDLDPGVKDSIGCLNAKKLLKLG